MILNIPPWPVLFQTLSSWATSSVEEVASTGPGIRFFQLYVNTLTLHYYNTSIFLHQLSLSMAMHAHCHECLGLQGQESGGAACEES